MFCRAAEQSSGYQVLQMCWSLAVLERIDTEAFQASWKQLHRQQSEIGMSSKAALQYCQVGAYHNYLVSLGM